MLRMFGEVRVENSRSQLGIDQFPSTDYACSMAKLGATATQTAQLRVARLLDFRGFLSLLI